MIQFASCRSVPSSFLTVCTDHPRLDIVDAFYFDSTFFYAFWKSSEPFWHFESWLQGPFSKNLRRGPYAVVELSWHCWSNYLTLLLLLMKWQIWTSVEDLLLQQQFWHFFDTFLDFLGFALPAGIWWWVKARLYSEPKGWYWRQMPLHLPQNKLKEE